MNLDDLKDRFSSELKTLWERIQENDTYNQLRDRYENMTPNMQKLVLVGSSTLIALLILSVPYSTYIQSIDYENEFRSRRDTIRELLKVSRASSDVPALQPAPDMSTLRNMAQSTLQNARLLPEQMQGLEILDESTKLIPQNLTAGLLQVKLAKLNLRQVLDIGHSLQSINPSVKVKDLVMTANREDSRYYDVLFKLVALSVPSLTEGDSPAAAGGLPPQRNRNNRDR